MQRKALQRHADTPEWIRSHFGMTAADEANAERREAAHDAAENLGAHGGGSAGALDEGVRAQAESKLGVSLDDVRVVTGADAACGEMGAMAFATPAEGGGGHEVHLASSVSLDSADGQFTLMHELSHVAQQKRGETAGLEGLGGDEGKRESLERAADADAARMVPPC